MGHIGVHHPREILRVERDYTGGEVIQFAPIYPLELENRVSSPNQLAHSFVPLFFSCFAQFPVAWTFLGRSSSVQWIPFLVPDFLCTEALRGSGVVVLFSWLMIP